MTLLEECIEVLGKDIHILNNDEKQVVKDEFYNIIPLTKWGRINWDKFKNKKEVKELADLNLIEENEKYYIIWDIEKPIIKSEFVNILNNLDDVLAVSFDTWLLAEDESMVIEFYHEGEVTIGMLADLI